MTEVEVPKEDIKVEVKKEDEKKNIKVTNTKDEKCESCGKIVASIHMRRHMKSNQCYSFNESMNIIRENIEKIKTHSKFEVDIQFDVHFDYMVDNIKRDDNDNEDN